MEIFKSKIKDIVVVLIFVTMLIIGTKYDFRISDNVYSRNNWFNVFAEIFAKIPVYFLALYSAVGLFRLSLQMEAPKKYLFLAVYAIGGVICGTLMFEDVVSAFGTSKAIQEVLANNNITENIKYIISAVFAIILFFVLLKFSSTTYEECKESKKEYIALLIAVAIVVVLTFLLKNIMDRTRFSDLLMRKGAFSNWYEKGFGGDSFPSGHMASSVLLFAALPLLKKMGFVKFKDYINYILLTIYCLLVALSRISHGSHFMSDVAFSGLLAFIISKIVIWILFKFNEEDDKIPEGSLLDKI